jgi:hypothetical protein
MVFAALSLSGERLCRGWCSIRGAGRWFTNPTIRPRLARRGAAVVSDEEDVIPVSSQLCVSESLFRELIQSLLKRSRAAKIAWLSGVAAVQARYRAVKCRLLSLFLEPYQLRLPPVFGVANDVVPRVGPYFPASWIVQQLREAFPYQSVPEFPLFEIPGDCEAILAT